MYVYDLDIMSSDNMQNENMQRTWQTRKCVSDDIPKSGKNNLKNMTCGEI